MSFKVERNVLDPYITIGQEIFLKLKSSDPSVEESLTQLFSTLNPKLDEIACTIKDKKVKVLSDSNLNDLLSKFKQLQSSQPQNQKIANCFMEAIGKIEEVQFQQ